MQDLNLIKAKLLQTERQLLADDKKIKQDEAQAKMTDTVALVLTHLHESIEIAHHYQTNDALKQQITLLNDSIQVFAQVSNLKLNRSRDGFKLLARLADVSANLRACSSFAKAIDSSLHSYFIHIQSFLNIATRYIHRIINAMLPPPKEEKTTTLDSQALLHMKK